MFLLNLELRKKGKFFRYRVSSIIRSRIGNWDELPKSMRKELKRKYLDGMLGSIPLSVVNNNENVSMEINENINQNSQHK